MSTWTTSIVLDGGTVALSDSANILNGRPVRGLHNSGATDLQLTIVFKDAGTLLINLKAGAWIEIAAIRVNATASDATTALRWFL